MKQRRALFGGYWLRGVVGHLKCVDNAGGEKLTFILMEWGARVLERGEEHMEYESLRCK